MPEFYDRHPYPPPADDVVAYRRIWDDRRRRATSFLFWPHAPYRDDRSVLVAGCGTLQAVHYALRWPNARVVGIDVSPSSLAHADGLRRRYDLRNLELRELPIERAGELRETFEHVACTGVLHHLPDPGAALRALRAMLHLEGTMQLMLYAPYGRAGIYLLQRYCRMLGLGSSDRDVDELAAALRALPPDHPIVPLLRASPDFTSKAGLADALLHPLDRAFSVPELLALVEACGMTFERWMHQAPYSPACGALASSPHRARLEALASPEPAAAVELFRGTMVRHSFVAVRDDRPPVARPEFSTAAWRRYRPIRTPEATTVRERLPEGAAAVLINRAHTFTDLYLPIDERQLRMLSGIDGVRRLGEIADENVPGVGPAFFETLYRWDQIVLDISDAGKPLNRR